MEELELEVEEGFARLRGTTRVQWCDEAVEGKKKNEIEIWDRTLVTDLDRATVRDLVTAPNQPLGELIARRVPIRTS